MAISNKNKVLYQDIYTSIIENKNIKIFKEFGFYNYIIFRESDRCN